MSKNKKYYVICIEEKSREGSLLFWKEGGKGYTSDLEEAGLFSDGYAKDMNEEGRDIALTKEQLFDLPFVYKTYIVNCSLNQLCNIKKKLENKKEEEHE